jgi:hypothetical protein
MNINRNNYEVYMIDYLDGKLDALEVSELLLFVEQHPDIKKEFDLLNEVAVVPVIKEEYIDKNALKKPSFTEIRSHYQEQLVANLEGDLSIYEQYELERSFAVYPQLKAEAELYTKTKFQPDLSVVFPQKKQLKRRGVVISLNVRYAWRVAAVFIAFALIVFLTRVPQQYLENGAGISSEQLLSASNETPKTTTASTQKGGSGQHKATPTPLTTQSFNTPSNAFVEPDKVVEEIKSTQVKTIERMPLKVATNENVLALNKPLIAPVKQYLVYPVVPEKTIEEPYKELVQLANEKVTEGVLVEQNKPDSASGKPAISNMGLLLVKLYNKATGDSAKVVKKYDNDGNITRVTIIADNFEFSRRR